MKVSARKRTLVAGFAGILLLPVTAAAAAPAPVAYEVVRRAGRESDFAALGVQPLQSASSASALYERIEQELYARSLAQYERDFHVSAQ